MQISHLQKAPIKNNLHDLPLASYNFVFYSSGQWSEVPVGPLCQTDALLSTDAAKLEHLKIVGVNLDV
jgi:hypothetical protein